MTVVPIHKANGHAFEQFWELCPKRTHRLHAQFKWSQITSEKGYLTATYDKYTNQFIPALLRATPDELIEGMKRYRKKQIDPQTYGFKDGGKFLVNPSAWLSEGGWMDE